MNEMTRRAALQYSAALGVPMPQPPAAEPAKKPQSDRDCVIGAGMTPEEADCWAAVADAAGKFFALPKQHPMDQQEVASAIHVIQNKLLSRPTYRRYLELAKQREK